MRRLSQELAIWLIFFSFSNKPDTELTVSTSYRSFRDITVRDITARGITARGITVRDITARGITVRCYTSPEDWIRYKICSIPALSWASALHVCCYWMTLNNRTHGRKQINHCISFIQQRSHMHCWDRAQRETYLWI